MKRYAILNSSEDVIGVCNSFIEAKEAAKNSNRAKYIRPIDEESSHEEGEIVVDFGNCYAFAVE